MSSETKQQIHGTLLKRVFSREIFALGRKLLKYRPALLTAALRREFGIYDIDQPAPSNTSVNTLSPSAEPQPQ